MPLYEYRCLFCNGHTDVFRSMEDRNVAPECSHCNAGTARFGMVRRYPSPPIHWKDHRPGNVTAREIMNGADPVDPSRPASDFEHSLA